MFIHKYLFKVIEEANRVSKTWHDISKRKKKSQNERREEDMQVASKSLSLSQPLFVPTEHAAAEG